MFYICEDNQIENIINKLNYVKYKSIYLSILTIKQHQPLLCLEKLKYLYNILDQNELKILTIIEIINTYIIFNDKILIKYYLNILYKLLKNNKNKKKYLKKINFPTKKIKKKIN